MNLSNNNLIFSGNNREFESVFILRKIKRFITKHQLPICVKEIDSLSKKSIELSIKHNINTIPYAIYKNRVLIYKPGEKEEKVDNQILDFIRA